LVRKLFFSTLYDQEHIEEPFSPTLDPASQLEKNHFFKFYNHRLLRNFKVKQFYGSYILKRLKLNFLPFNFNFTHFFRERSSKLAAKQSHHFSLQTEKAEYKVFFRSLISLLKFFNASDKNENVSTYKYLDYTEKHSYKSLKKKKQSFFLFSYFYNIKYYEIYIHFVSFFILFIILNYMHIISYLIYAILILLILSYFLFLILSFSSKIHDTKKEFLLDQFILNFVIEITLIFSVLMILNFFFNIFFNLLFLYFCYSVFGAFKSSPFIFVWIKFLHWVC